jgi:hypothetical protein
MLAVSSLRKNGMHPDIYHILTWVVIGAFIFWRLYARLQRSVGRQVFRKKLLIYLIILYSVISLGLAVMTEGRLQLVSGWAGGLVLGVLLGGWALRLTRYETTEKGPCYTPNAHLGGALFLIFLGRLIYRGVAFYTHFSLTGHPPPPPGQSALTDFTFELLAGYFIAYYIGVLRHFAEKGGSANSVG